MKNLLREIFGFSEHQQKAIGYKLTLTRSSDNSVLNKAHATKIAKIEIIGIEWCVPHYTLSMEQQKIKSE